MSTLIDKIIQTLIKSQNISEQSIQEAIILQKKKGVSLSKALVDMQLIKERDLLMLLVKELNIPFINLSKYKIDPVLQELIPEKVARQYKIIPLSSLDSSMTIAVADPMNVVMIDDLKSITGKEIDIVMSTVTDIEKAIDKYYGNSGIATVTDITKDIQVDEFEIVQENLEESDSNAAVGISEKAPVIRMVNLIVKEAIRQRASDIHMEPMVDGMRVRYRIDGILREILNVPKESQSAMVVRIKIMSRMDITVNHTPQDGRFKMKVGTKEVDFRVSLLPTTFGQKVVMRILDKANLSVGLNGLGISKKARKTIDEGIKKPFGMILVTGPTGSGKSTTLYSILNELNTVERNIITVEDPVEYLIEGLTQIHARPEIGLTFAEGLRAILRQSPDVVMVGEIRDNETADIAIKASLTGQLVLSTLHTNDSAGALTRLIDMGVEPFLVASSLVLVSAQRLCRKICSLCREEIVIPRKALEEINYPFAKDQKFFKGKGCEACKMTGYLGRMSVTEVLEVDEKVRELLIKGKTSDDIKEYAVKEQNMDTLWVDAMNKCVAGLTSFEEVFRITSEE